jgi:hypothetical protein
MEKTSHKPIPENYKDQALKPKQVEVNTSHLVDEEFSDNISSLREEWLEKYHRKVREEIYDRIIDGGMDTPSIFQMTCPSEYSMTKELKDAIFCKGYFEAIYGIGVHPNVMADLKEMFTGAVDEAPDIPEVFGLPMLTDPRRSRDEALFFRSPKIWKAYQELLNDEVPTMVKRLLQLS